DPFGWDVPVRERGDGDEQDVGSAQPGRGTAGVERRDADSPDSEFPGITDKGVNVSGPEPEPETRGLDRFAEIFDHRSVPFGAWQIRVVWSNSVTLPDLAGTPILSHCARSYTSV